MPCLQLAVPRKLEHLTVSIADAWENAVEVPKHASYMALCAESWRQAELIETSFNCRLRGVHHAETYSDLANLSYDITHFDRLEVSTITPRYTDGHPLFKTRPVGPILWHFNSLFRAAHDFFGHFVAQAPFSGPLTFEGEIAAWHTHKQLTFASAHPALFSETIGQLAYYALHGVHPPVQRPVILPESLMRDFDRLTKPFGDQ